jgi:hypothetical protein
MGSSCRMFREEPLARCRMKVTAPRRMRRGRWPSGIMRIARRRTATRRRARRDGGVRQELAAGVERRDFAPRMVAGSPTGCTEALLYGISADVLVELINIDLRSWDRSWDRTIIDVMVRRTHADCELRYLPQATEEDRGTHPFARTGLAAAGFLAALALAFSLVATATESRLIRPAVKCGRTRGHHEK